MLTQHFLSIVSEFLKELQSRYRAQGILEVIADEYAAIAAAQNGMLNAAVGGQLTSQRDAAVNAINKAAETIATIHFHILYQGLDAIQAAVERFRNQLKIAHPGLDRVLLSINQFRDQLQAFLSRKHTPEDTYGVVIAARTLTRLLAEVGESFQAIREELEYEPPPDSATLTLVYDATPDLKELVKLLDALLSLWQEICREFDADAKPPLIARLETGSLTALVVGSPVAATALMLLVTQWARIKRFLDPAGSAATALGATVDLATLSDFMRSRGMETEHLDKAIARIAQNQAAQLRLATDGIIEVRHNNKDVAIVETMRLLDNKNANQRQIEHKPDNQS